MAQDSQFMHRCIQLALNGREGSRPNPMVGAVIVSQEGRIIGEGYHVRCGEGHAEVNAFASVKAEDEHLLSQSTIYVSLEPCAHYGKTPPCCDLIIKKGVRRVVVGCVDPFSEVQGRGIERIRAAGIEVTVGVLENECRWLNRRFFTFHEKKRPYIILKWAQTSDGFIDNNGHALAISTPFTKMLVHQLRAEEDAILVGRVTDEREHPRLDVREWSGRSPERFVLSHENGIEKILNECYERSLQSLIVEGGRMTLQSFIDSDLWDEIRVETSTQSLLQDGETKNGSTSAPIIPQNAICYRTECFDNNTIAWYKR